MEKLFVLDVSGFVYRSYHALPSMTNGKGLGTQGLYGFIRVILKLIKDFNPTHMVAVFEGIDNKRSRLAIYPQYKATRTKAPEDLPQQLVWAEEFCRLQGIATLSYEGFESDDAMGSIAVWARDTHAEVFLCTADKDLYQFIGDSIKVLQTHKNNLILDREAIEKQMGVSPSQVVDYLSLIGDASDNIPGVPGIGPKGAADLLKQFISLKGLYENIDQVKKKKALLEEHKERAFLSYKLALINIELPVPQEESFYKIKEADLAKLQEFYQDMNFNSLITKATAKNVFGDYKVVAPSSALFKELIEAPLLVFDCKKTFPDSFQSSLIGVGFCSHAGIGSYLPCYENKEALIFLKNVFKERKSPLIAHNAKHHLHALKRHDIEVSAPISDTMLYSYLLFSEQRQHSLDFLAERFLSLQRISFKELVGKGSLMDLPLEVIAGYCGLDTDLIFQLYAILSKKIEERGLKNLLEEIELPVLEVLYKIEERGIYLDKKALSHTGIEVMNALHAVEDKIYSQVGEHFNINSPKQLAEILFDRLQITAGKKTSTGQRSTNADVLDELAGEHPVVENILEYRMLEKLRSTYIEALPSYINSETGRIHPSFNQFVAATGRLSCQDPNLQNIPVRNELGRAIRAAFKPQNPDWLYLAADYSQIELRMLAHLSEDRALLQAFEQGEDIHAYTASLIFNISIKAISSEQRRTAKVVNFGIIYGQQPFGLSKELKCSVKEAALFIELYFSRYPGVKDFFEDCKEKARQTGYAVTMRGRQREIPEIKSRNAPLRAAAERLAINTPLQGSSADLIKMAMIQVETLIKKAKSFLVLQIHDELLFEMDPLEENFLKKSAITAMQGVMSLKVPLVVDISIGKNWKEC
ncbi:MAG: DNA polymerase I [Chlamydiae bacterium]|nr:DNA polymerase I [Chlamydiota bacterium]